MQARDVVSAIAIARKPRPRPPTARRTREQPLERGYRFGSFEVVPELWALRRRGEPVDLTRTPFRLLLYLLEQRDRVVSKQELLDAVWPDAVVSDTALSTALKVLRCALEDDGARPRWIRTLRGRGYQFIGALDAAPLRTRSELTREALPSGAAVIDLNAIPEAAAALEAIARAVSVATRDPQRRNAVLVVW